jgi:phospholipid-binding lipoprotein MlaA
MFNRILNNKNIFKLFLIQLMLILLSSCAQNSANKEINDPLESMNRSVFKFNQGLDKYVFKPINTEYEKLPENVKKGVSNHVKWASTPVTIANSAIQLEAENFSTSSIKFLLNSLTLGFYDLDPETKYKTRDFGSSLAKYNVSSGPYIVLPILGPRSLRHFSGNIVDQSVSNGPKNHSYNSTTLPMSILSNRNTYSNIIEDIYNAQDPYLKAKILYTENRFNSISSTKLLELQKQNEQNEFEKLLD